jgi:PAS domain S-box-containing protein
LIELYENKISIEYPMAEVLKNKKPAGTGEVQIDFMEYQRSMQTLRESEDKYRTLVEKSLDAIAIVKGDKFVFVNKAFLEMFGYESDKEVIGSAITDYLAPQSRALVRNRGFARERGERILEVYEVKAKKKDGSFFDVELFVGLITFQGEIARQGIIRDITQRKKMEQAFRESEGKFRLFQSSVFDVIYRYDPQNNRYDFISPSVEQQTGYTMEEFLTGPKEITQCITHPEDWERVQAEVKQEIAKGTPGRPFRVEYRITRKDGREIWVSDQKTLEFSPQGKLCRINGVVRDITERKQAEEKLKDYTRQIEEKNLELKIKNLELTTTRAQLVQKEKLQALGQMASGVAHNFNNLLAIILGRAQLLQRKAKDMEIERGLRNIERAALDASSTIKRIQDFARVRKDQEFKWVDIDEVIEDVIALTKTKWKDQAEANGISIRLEVQKDRRRLPPVAGDESELKEAFTSIVFNAVDAMPKGGKIVIRSRTNRKSVFVYFIDSGIGISEEAKQKIFDPFFTTKGVKNAGLGLSVAYGIIQRHQGDIQIEGKPGEGTTVVVRLPVSKILGKEEPKEKEPEKPPVQKESANILIIEDEKDLRELFFDILTSADYMVKVTSSGAEGLEIYKREKFDIVFTDLGMPRMSGWEVAKAIKEMDSNTTVLLLTGWGVEMDEEKLKESGIDRIVAKPIKVENLLTLVSEIMQSKKRTREPVEGFLRH